VIFSPKIVLFGSISLLEPSIGMNYNFFLKYTNYYFCSEKRVKTANEKGQPEFSKFLILRTSKATIDSSKQLGKLKGVVKGYARFPLGGGLVIYTKTGENLELKVSNIDFKIFATII
jgi:hypothetical protein